MSEAEPAVWVRLGPAARHCFDSEALFMKLMLVVIVEKISLTWGRGCLSDKHFPAVCEALGSIPEPLPHVHKRKGFEGQRV